MGEIKFTGALLMTALFSVALIGFIIGFSSDNNSSYGLDGDFNNTKEGINGTLTIWNSDINTSSKSFSDSEIQSQETFKTGGQFKGGMVSVMTTTKSALSLGFKKIFGDDPAFAVFLTSLFAFLTYTLIRLVYKTWVGRNPE